MPTRPSSDTFVWDMAYSGKHDLIKDELAVYPDLDCAGVSLAITVWIKMTFRDHS